MPKRSKSPSNDNQADAVQRASVRRAQAGSKRRARNQAERTAGKAAPAPTRSARSATEPGTPVLSTGLRRPFVWMLIAVAVMLIGVSVRQNSGSWWAAFQTNPSPLIASSTPPSAPTAMPTQVQLARIGIISGHRGNDSGAVCDDGLTEASINFDTATRVTSRLRAEGYDVIILDEFDPRLNGLKVDALLSIHADSCKYINNQATGYKVARFLYSDIPQIEDKLVACISARYKRSTGLRFHANTVTHNMLEYHALRKIDPKTPGAIIELGFMNLDRAVLTKRKDDMARGIAEGLMCFLRDEKP